VVLHRRAAESCVSSPTGRDSLARGGVGALAGAAASVLLGFIASVVLARGLGPSGKGAYDIALASSAILSLLLGLSLSAGITYTVARRVAFARVLLPRFALIAGVQGLSAIAALTLVLATPLRDVVLPPELGQAAILPIGLLVGFVGLSSLARAALMGLQRVVSANARDVAGRIVTVTLLLAAATIITGSSHQPAAIAMLWATVAGTAAGAALQIRGVIRATEPSTQRIVLRPALGYALPAHLGNVVQFLNYRLDQYLVVFFVGTAELGTYALAVTLGQLVWLLSNAGAQVLLPRVASEEGLVAQGVIAARVTRVSVALGLLAAVALALCAGPLIPLIYGASFAPAFAPLLLLLPGIVAFGAVNVLASYVAGRGRPGLNTGVAMLGLLVTLGFDVALIPRFGGAGAAIASSISYSVSTVATVAIATRLGGLTVRELLVPTAADFRDGIRILRSVRSR
jgi:stage V sporulation protein B